MDETVSQTRTSILGKAWQHAEVSERHVTHLMQALNLPEIIARTMAARGIEFEQAEDYLNPSIKHLLPDPFHLIDMDKAVARLCDALEAGQKISVFGDYDVDGATSTAVLKRFFAMLGSDILFHIPDRMKEGYGPNAKALIGLKEQGADLCITVDCGILSFDPLAAAKEVGLDVIVVDHHKGDLTMPEAVAIVNPNRADETSPYGYLAAVGVVFLLCVAVNQELRRRNFYHDRSEPNLLSLLDIVALGTVCDVVPLVGINRAFVAQGLKVMRKRQNVGIAALSDAAGIDSTPQSYHLGFMLGPRINAGGRIGQANLGASLLCTHDPIQAQEIAQNLHSLNGQRQDVEASVLDDAMAQVAGKQEDNPVIFVHGHDWHPGVIGIVASRIKEAFHRPVAVLATEGKVAKASARSIPGVDFGKAVIEATQAGLLVAGGGHAMAAGFTVELEKIPDLHAFLSSRFQAAVADNAVPTITIDGALSAAGASIELLNTLARLEPFGQHNPEPRFVFNNMAVVKVNLIKDEHVSCILADSHAARSGGTIKAMAFRCMSTDLGPALLAAKGKVIDVVGKVSINNWNGYQSPQLIIDDVAL